MNNEEFRRLLLSNSLGHEDDDNAVDSRTSSGQAASSLGSRQRISTHMIPRSLVGSGGPDFTNQLSQRSGTQQAKRKAKSSTPKGVALAEGYVDRARERTAKQGDIEDDRATRIKALEDALKDGHIDQLEFNRLRGHIAGGNFESTHLVKGLDFKLLERVRRGEDIFNATATTTDADLENTLDRLDDELDQIQQSEIKALNRENRGRKHGQLSTVASIPSKTRTRDQILAEFKAARATTKTQHSRLGRRFKKVGNQQLVPGTERVEVDSTGRKVKIVVDEDGHERTTVLQEQPGNFQAEVTARKQFDVNRGGNVLGIEVPDVYRKQQEEASTADEEDDIFSDVGDEYDPLAGLDSSERVGSNVDGETEHQSRLERSDCKEVSTPATKSHEVLPMNLTKPRNYFQGSKIGLISAEKVQTPSATDVAFLSAIRKAASLKMSSLVEQQNIIGEEEDQLETRRQDERRFKMLEPADRDEADMDLGFGMSRFGDEDDYDDRLSKWGEKGRRSSKRRKH